MKINIKAMFLSALVFPGMGQLYKGERVKGMILFIVVNILLLVAFFLIMRQLLPLVLSAQASSPTDVAKTLIALLCAPGSPFLLLMASLGGFWFYGVIDAMLERKKRE